MFYVYIILFAFISTFFGNFVLSTGFFLLIILLLFVVNYFKSINIKKQVLSLLISFFLISISVIIKNYFFYHDYDFSNKYFNENALIQDVLGVGKYSIKNDSNQEFILFSSKKYDIGDKIFLIGNINYFNTGNFLFDNNVNAFDFFKGYYFMKGTYGNVYEKNSVYIGNGDVSLPLKIKRYFRDKVIKSYGENKIAGLVMGMTIGDKSLIPQDDYQNFINSSLVHIIAVSGGNLAVLIIFLSVILFFLPFYLRQAIILFSCIIFAFVCGMSSSIFRALIMSMLIIIALFGGKKIDGWKTIFWAIVFMLVINPYFLIYDLGFLLSFAAIFGIKLFNIKFCRNNKINNFLNPIFGAYLFTLPVILLYTGKISLFGFLSNIVVLPFVGLIMIYGFLSVIFYQIFPWEILIKIGEYMIKGIYLVGEIFANNNLYLTIDNIYIRIYFFVIFILFVGYKYYLGFRSLEQISKSD